MFEVGRALYGSQNYNLAGPDSDKDYKVFLCPDFEDLYNCHTADKMIYQKNMTLNIIVFLM